MSDQRDTGRTSLRSTALLALAGVLTAVATSCGPSGAGGTDGPGRAAESVRTAQPPPSTEERPARVRYGVPDDIVPMLFPATGAETRQTQGLDGFLDLARYVGTRRCAPGKGSAGAADGPPPMFVRRFAVPDLAYVAAHGFTSPEVPAPAGPGPSAPPGAASGPAPCAPGGAGADASAVGRGFAELRAEWWRALARLDDDPEVRRAYGEAGGCLAPGVRGVAGEEAFFSRVDARLHALDGAGREAERAREDRRLGALYARCMGPVETVRERLRARHRQGFLLRHADRLAVLRRTLPRDVARLESRYGIRFSSPRL
ncbi:hypothetical protein ACH4ZU_34170 [Streptomyces sp. NPDC020472]|uniref:hypothetical protein n=1 Tax=Streptomyces sp. NPDC020472 TaxID=3365075 RepID=UPI0037889997